LRPCGLFSPCATLPDAHLPHGARARRLPLPPNPTAASQQEKSGPTLPCPLCCRKQQRRLVTAHGCGMIKGRPTTLINRLTTQSNCAYGKIVFVVIRVAIRGGNGKPTPDLGGKGGRKSLLGVGCGWRLRHVKEGRIRSAARLRRGRHGGPPEAGTSHQHTQPVKNVIRRARPFSQPSGPAARHWFVDKASEYPLESHRMPLSTWTRLLIMLHAPHPTRRRPHRTPVPAPHRASGSFALPVAI
jgi:hypothetical protein